MEIALTLNSLARRSAAKTAHSSTLNHLAAAGVCRDLVLPTGNQATKVVNGINYFVFSVCFCQDSPKRRIAAAPRNRRRGRRGKRNLRFVVVARANLLNCPPMNILIENHDTREYLTQEGHWTKNPLDGKHFPATATAFRAAKLEAIGKFNIVCHIPGTNQFVNLDHGRGTGMVDGEI